MLNLSLSTVQAVEELRASSTRHYLVFAFAVGVFTLATALLVTVGALAFQSPLADYENALRILFAAGGFIVSVMLLWGFWHGHRILSDARAHWTAWQNAERDAKYPEIAATETAAPLPLPTAPPIPITSGGERAGEIVAELVNGFDPRTLDWFAQYLVNGGRTSEAGLEKLPIPYDVEIPARLFGGATEGTPLTRLLNLCEERGILSARDSKSRKSGKLLVTDEKVVAARLKETKGETL